jgi:hypothetical protein
MEKSLEGYGKVKLVGVYYMRMMHKMIIYYISTILFMLLDAYVVYNVLIITDRWVATFVGTILFCIYIVCFWSC